MVGNLKKYKNLFIEKFSENISMIQAQLPKLISGSFQSADLDPLIRIFHNIKSDAGIMEYRSIAVISGRAEALLKSGKDRTQKSSAAPEDLTSQLNLIGEVAEFFRQICREDILEMGEQAAERLTLALEQAIDSENTDYSNGAV